MKQKPRLTIEHGFCNNGRSSQKSSTKIPNNLIGPQVKRQREVLGLTQSQLAQRVRDAGLKVGKTAIARIETQRRYVSDIEFLALARFLETTPDVLLPIKDPAVQRDAQLMRGRRIPDRHHPSYTAQELRRILPGLQV